MKTEKINPKSDRKPRTVRTLDEVIALQQEKLKKLKERQRDKLRKDQEKNQKAVMELIKTEQLDLISPDLWGKAMPSIKMLLVAEPVKSDAG